MTCRELTDKLLEYVAAELSPEEDLVIQQHLDICSHCAHFTHTYRLTIHVTRRLSPRPIPRPVAERLEAALREACDKPTA